MDYLHLYKSFGYFTTIKLIRQLVPPKKNIISNTKKSASQTQNPSDFASSCRLSPLAQDR